MNGAFIENLRGEVQDHTVIDQRYDLIAVVIIVEVANSPSRVGNTIRLVRRIALSIIITIVGNNMTTA